jgi:ferredoxin-NADP reductase
LKFETEVIKTLKRTPDVKSIQFFRPPSVEYQAGQFMFITLRSKDKELKKHFTISSSPTEKNYIELTKKLTGHPFSNLLDELNIGDKVKIDGPYGKFIFDKKIKKIGMLSGGIGITPLRSICRYITDLQLQTNIILLYGNNSKEDIAYKQEFDQIQKENNNFKVVHTLIHPPSDWDGHTGYIDAEMIRKEVPDYTNRVHYTCGPPAMVKSMKKLLEDLNISKDQIKTENFSGY